jgi:hypothetical protein
MGVDIQMKYKQGFKYQLVEDETFTTRIFVNEKITTDFIQLRRGGMLTVKSGYAWDGPSGPTIDTRNSLRGSLFHDAAYQLLRQELLPARWREEIDEQFGKFLRQDGMSSIRSYWWVRELKNFGGSAAAPRNVKSVLIAP